MALLKEGAYAGFLKDADDTTEPALIKVGVALNMDVSQYKLSANCGENGIRARGYLICKADAMGGEVVTVYTARYSPGRKALLQASKPSR